jgi:hypothetical protein
MTRADEVLPNDPEMLKAMLIAEPERRTARPDRRGIAAASLWPLRR